MRHPRRKQRKTLRRKNAEKPPLGRIVLLLWAFAALPWGYTFWALLSHFYLRRHVHLSSTVLVFDVTLITLAVWMSIEWFGRKRA